MEMLGKTVADLQSAVLLIIIVIIFSWLLVLWMDLSHSLR